MVMKRIVYLLVCLFVGLLFMNLLPASSPEVVTAVSEPNSPTSINLLSNEPTNQHTTNKPGITTIYLPLILNAAPNKPGSGYDMVQFMAGTGGILYEVQHSSGSQARHQTQVEPARFYHTKGNEVSAEWEELWYDDTFIWRGTDTSPGNNQYYTLRSGKRYGSAWSPRYWNVGDIFERDPIVTFYDKNNCVPQSSGLQRTWLKFEAYYASYTFSSGITLDNVVQLAWLLSPTAEPLERYFYAQGYGLVGWWSSNQGMSYISEIHAPGQRPDNRREAIRCLNYSGISPKGLPAPLQYAK
jgi:hypothetical protein